MQSFFSSSKLPFLPKESGDVFFLPPVVSSSPFSHSQSVPEKFQIKSHITVCIIAYTCTAYIQYVHMYSEGHHFLVAQSQKDFQENEGPHKQGFHIHIICSHSTYVQMCTCTHTYVCMHTMYTHTCGQPEHVLDTYNVCTYVRTYILYNGHTQPEYVHTYVRM